MATPQMSEDLLRDTLSAYAANGYNQVQTAKALGIARGTLQSRLRAADLRGVDARPSFKDDMVSFPPFIDGDEEESIEDILRRQLQNFERKQKAHQARKWFPIHIKETKPYAINWFGDPHLDNGGTNWPLLNSHIAICKQDGIYGANIGDTTDNWPWTGKLARLWAESEVSNKTAKRLAEWFMFDAGVKWLVWLLGNHDEWQGGSEFYKRLGAYQIPVVDWRAQFRLVHNNGSEVRLDASHGRKGNSLYNPSHGTLRDAKFGEEADVWVTGHIHSFKLDHFEIPERGKTTWLAQVRGYKFLDHHALVNGFSEYQNGASIFTVIDPETAKVMCFSDPEEGAEYLHWLRSKK